MRKWVDELFIIIMDMLQDSSLLAKRQVSITESWRQDRRTDSMRPGPCLSQSPQCLQLASSTWYVLWNICWLRKGRKDLEPELAVILARSHFQQGSWLTSAVSSRQKKMQLICQGPPPKGKKKALALGCGCQQSFSPPSPAWLPVSHWGH